MFMQRGVSPILEVVRKMCAMLRRIQGVYAGNLSFRPVGKAVMAACCMALMWCVCLTATTDMLFSNHRRLGGRRKYRDACAAPHHLPQPVEMHGPFRIVRAMDTCCPRWWIMP